MQRLIEFPLEGGGSIVVAADDDIPSGSAVRGRGGDLMARADQTLEAAMARVQPAAEAMLGRFRALTETPESVQIEFGISLRAEAGAVIAKGSGEANFKVTLRWDRDGS